MYHRNGDKSKLVVADVPHGRQIQHVPGVQRDAQRPCETGQGRWAGFGVVHVPRCKRHRIGVLVQTEGKVIALTDICRRREKLLVHTGVADRREEGEMLPAANLDEDVLEVVLVGGGDGP